jgi:hypothetical protein
MVKMMLKQSLYFFYRRGPLRKTQRTAKNSFTGDFFCGP